MCKKVFGCEAKSRGASKSRQIFLMELLCKDMGKATFLAKELLLQMPERVLNKSLKSASKMTLNSVLNIELT